MSIHKSLRLKARLARSRNVLTRAERIEMLEKEGRWKEEEDEVFGLPKVKVLRVKAGRKKKKKKEEAAEGAAAAPGAAPTAAPAAGAAAAAPAAKAAPEKKGKEDKKKK